MLATSFCPEFKINTWIFPHLKPFFSLWSRDFSDVLDIYPLKAVNQLESTFLALTNYELYVSEGHYDNYYEKIIKRTQ